MLKTRTRSPSGGDQHSFKKWLEPGLHWKFLEDMGGGNRVA